jgi:hypothetical protein
MSGEKKRYSRTVEFTVVIVVVLLLLWATW